MEQDLSKVEKLYTGNLKQFGIDSKSVGWNDGKSHEMRFDALVYIMQGVETKNVVINDLGCGYGAMYTYLKNHKIPFKQFIGYDISEEMVKAAKKLITANDAKFLVSSKLTHKADYSFTSGIFNVKFEKDIAFWQEYVKETLQDIDQHSKKGFAFNLLSKYVDYKVDHLYYADPLFYFDFCKKNFSRQVSLLHDYPLYEWTIIVKK